MVQLWDLPEDPQSQGKDIKTTLKEKNWRRKKEKLSEIAPESGCTGVLQPHSTACRVLAGCNAHRNPAPLTSSSSGPAPPGQTETPTAVPAEAPLWSAGMCRGQHPGTREMCPHQGKSLGVLTLEGGRCLVQIRGGGLSFFFFSHMWKWILPCVTRNCLLVPLLFIQNPNLHGKAF